MQSSGELAWVVLHFIAGEGTVRLDRDARPLLLIEDPETRLHPIMLSVALAFAESAATAASDHDQFPASCCR